MPINPRLYGPAPGTVGDRQVAQAPTTKAASPPIPLDQFFRNGKYPDADAMNMMNGQMNQAMVYRTKEVWGYRGILGAASGIGLSSSASDVVRHRGAFHTSPYTNMLLCRVVLYPQTANFTTSSHTVIDITNSAGTVLFTADFNYGTNPLNSANTTGWQHLKYIDKQITGLSADTDYYVVVTDKTSGLLQSVSIAELNSMTTNYQGYLPMNFTGETNVVAEYRANLVAPMPSLWKRGGAALHHWTVNQQASPRTNATTTPTNLYDGTSTTFGTSIPGITLNMQGRARRGQTTVPCKLFVYMDSTSANNGTVRLCDSAGATVQNVNYLGGPNAPGWFSAAVNLPPTLAKYYLMSLQTTAAATIKVYAASLFQYE